MRGFKKQFRLYDLYRFVVTGKQSNILGIMSYEANEDASYVTVEFVDGRYHTWWPKNENDLKALVTEVNKMLGTCKKPGKRRKENVAQ